MSTEQRQALVQGLAAHAVALAGMGLSEAAARAQLVGMVRQYRTSDVTVVRDAAAEIARHPQPPDDSPQVAERIRAAGALIGYRGAEQQLSDALKAREWLEGLAADLGA